MSLQQQVAQSGVQVQRGPRTKGISRWRNELVGLGFVLPFLIAYALFLLWPVLLGLRMSFYNWNLAGGGTSDFRGLGNYQELFGDPNFWSSLWHTILFTVLSTPVLVVLALVLALLINRAIPAKWLFRLAFFAPFVLGQLADRPPCGHDLGRDRHRMVDGWRQLFALLGRAATDSP